ncbi:DNA polymerase III subunit gamma and tau [Agromyces intestinalis]|uniref:DNA polymerase III subunit gamma/tau n=1 Tax=Agromyces intestinalis TaxID=2592652 RepID=A0A5C1YC70_9MICO|nr:DNA polymerase III subunit gamma and tau [Agromyces intestinalis]QEO13694.1 DNA polymerase III subunit gamma and tau [Agromyces intestinalis]
MVTALYRRYRPETFAEMIGQSQVTEPLMTALRTDRVNHAYLFSGPRGCGKTTSARILARCLNCAEGPTDVPCGTCPSCIELSRGGGGSLDVVEIDAASHNGVDDARDLRERAVFAPARDRYKIFILDEAHMVTPQGFNALLKLVEEPPEHVKFIFATTEPDKVLGTIRSRTHHYPFRLVPPAPMLEYVQQLCDDEGISVAPGVLALVVRAGGGSPRDTLSLLDQLIAGSEGSSIDYERAVALLGYTHGALLDEVVDAIGANDAAGAFAAADRVVQTGQDPRRFVEDLLERLRDLIVVAASSPEAAKAVLRGVPDDELARMGSQAALFGAAGLSRVADLVNQTLTEMTGATSPRLHLELMLARVLVPAIDDSARGALARVERLERRVGVDGVPTVAGAPAAEPAVAGSASAASAPAAPAAASAPAVPAEASAAAAPAASARGASVPDASVSASTSVPAAPEPAAAPRIAPVGPVTLQQVRDAWPEVLALLQRTKRSAWMVAFTAQVREYRDGDVLVLAFPSEADVASFRGSPGNSVSELLRNAIAEVLGVRVKFIAKSEGTVEAPPADASPAPTPTDEGGAPDRGAPDAPQSPSGASPTAPAASSSLPQTPPNRSEPAPSTRAEPPAGGGGAATRAAAPKSGRASSAAVSGGAVSSWATVAIPADPPEQPGSADASAGGGHAASDASTPDATAGRASAATAIATAVRDAPAHDLPSDADAPPEDDEPPFDPGPPPEAVIDAAPAPVAEPRGVQRYGEAVVREVLGARFLEEVEVPGTGFGERS